MAENTNCASPGTNDYVVRMPGKRQAVFIKRRWIDNPSLSMKALGLLVYLEAHPDLPISIQSLMERFMSDNDRAHGRAWDNPLLESDREAIEFAINELLAEGYLVRAEEDGQ